MIEKKRVCIAGWFNAKTFSLLCVLLSVLPLHSQLYIPVTDDPFGIPLRFNADSVRSLKIHSVTNAFQYKPDGRIIDDKGLHDHYQFDLQGRLTFYWRMRVRGTESKVIEHPAIVRRGRTVKQAWSEYKYGYTYDTAFVYIYYDSLSREVTRRMCDGNYYHTWYYTYNEDNLISMQTHCRETNLGTSHRDFKPGVQTTLSEEVFRYEKYSSGQIKKLSLNDEGRVYKETVMEFDLTGRLIESREVYVAGGLRVTVSNEFDGAGRMKTYSYSSNAGVPVTEQSQYEYDSLGRIATVRRYKNTVLMDEFSYLYEGSAKMSYAYINRRHVELGIDIVKMQMEYYQ